MSKSKPILIVLALLALGAATLALADYEFEGIGTGQCGVIHPWANWEGTLYTDETPSFEGRWWWLSLTGNIFGDAEYDSETRCYYVEDGDWSTAGGGPGGKWDGYFCPSADTADGTWWATGGENCEGTFWGNLAD